MLLLTLSVLSGACSNSKDLFNPDDTTAVTTAIVLEETDSEPEETGDTLALAESSANIINTSTITDTSSSEMQVYFIDVGQGDSTLVKSGEHYMLIDAGDNSKGTLIQNYLQKQGISKIDYLVLTHPDADHIGGADVIVTKFDIDTIFMSDYTKDNRTYDNLIQAIKYKNYKYSKPEVGSVHQLGDATFTILAPNKTYSDPNNASIALIVQNGDNTFLFTGDAETEAENDILSNGLSVQADVYKAGHHGSKSSTSDDFFAAISPTYAVISCAEGNSYGHPHAQTLNTFRMNGVKVYRTDEQGTIIATSDGTNITFDVPASDTWKSGEPIGSAETSTVVEERVVPETVQETEAPSTVTETTKSADTNELTYVLNSKTKKFHYPSCGSLPTTNRVDSSKSRDQLIASGYVPCKKCNP